MIIANCLLFKQSVWRALLFARPHDCTQYAASILQVYWKIFPTFNVAKCEATVAEVL